LTALPCTAAFMHVQQRWNGAVESVP